MDKKPNLKDILDKFKKNNQTPNQTVNIPNIQNIKDIINKLKTKQNEQK